ncbi:hypothetical protein RDI58_009228 [Solanum bulbocastanum]|uniref:Uncharacterized protein n=1 Tax=Solanum bulbocastanum TaxID=147425 RepID=A0AAN8U3F1_SOLBU
MSNNSLFARVEIGMRLKKYYLSLLLYLNVSDSFSFTTIQVTAPRLRVFHFISRDGNFAADMDIHACKMIREFHLNCSKFPNGLDPENFCSDFPHLETLLLGPCQTEKPITISTWFLTLRSHLENFSNHNTTLELRIRKQMNHLCTIYMYEDKFIWTS